MTGKCAVFYSPGSERGAQLSLLKQAFENNKINAQFFSIKECEKQAPNLNVSIFVAAGGDGTVNTVASQAYKFKKTLAVVPLGTLNHFAKDSGIPLVMAQAVELISSGKATNIDVGMVNDQLFLNNSSIGIYPNVVRARTRLEKSIGKWPAALVVILFVARRRLKLLKLVLTLDGKTIERRSSLLFVGNNKYSLKGVGLPQRTRLKAGTLHIYILKTKRVDRLVKTAFYGFLGRSLPESYIERMEATDLKVTIGGLSRILTAFDGEICQQSLPLSFTIQGKSLSAIINNT